MWHRIADVKLHHSLNHALCHPEFLTPNTDVSHTSRLFTFFEVSCRNNVKNVESVVQVFTFLHFKIANEHFTVNNYTHLVLYIQHYIKTVHFWLKYNRLAIVRKTAKLIEGGHRGLQDYRHRPICYYLYVFYVFYVFSSKKSWLFTFFAVFRTFSRTMVHPTGHTKLLRLETPHTPSFCSIYSTSQSIALSPNEDRRFEQLYRSSETSITKWSINSNCELTSRLERLVAGVRSLLSVTAYMQMLSPVYLFFCLPVRLSHKWISQKQFKLWLCNFHHRVAHR